MVDIPMDGGPLAQGLGYRSDPAPTSDAADMSGSGTSQIPDLPQGEPSPTTAMNTETKQADANSMGARQTTTLHKDGWLNFDKPHVGTPED